YTGLDYPVELPITLRKVNMVWNNNPDHYRLKGTQAWAEWNAIHPSGGGYIYLGDAYHAFGVSMWHQIHCLNHLRTIIVNGDDGSDHTEHCFHYLRQGILCAADTTIEWGGSGMESGEEIIATGENTTHVCRDWTQVYDFMEENYKSWTPEMIARMRKPS
ncbi:hypothetical protein BDK51DRAFT_8317, partial [Blyttiomyces helicus]